MPTFLDLPGELRNGVYDAVLNHNRTIQLTEDGSVVQPFISCASRQIKHEFDSLFENVTSAPQVLEAKVLNFDVRGLHDYFHRNANHFDTQPHEAKVVMAMTDPNVELSTHYEALHDWLQTSVARGWNVKYHVEFDWRNYSLRDASHAARFFANRFTIPLDASTTLGGQMLQRAMSQAREARVRRELVHRPARWARGGDEPKSDLLRAWLTRADL